MFDDRVFSARRALAAAGIAGGLLVCLGGTAEAQFFGWWNAPTTYGAPTYGAPANAMISPAQIYRIISADGYRVTGGLRNNGRVYIVDVTDRWGQPLRLVVDAYEGNILQRFATAPPRPSASIPQSHSLLGELFQAPRSESYPSYPEGGLTPHPGPAARQSSPAPEFRRAPKSEARQKRSTHKTQTATRETGASMSSHTARSVAEPTHPADLVVPKSAKDAAPVKHENVTADVAPAAAKGAHAAPAPAKPAPTKTGPGYANGVPINPLD